MAQMSLNRAVALSAVAQVVSSAYVCPSGWSNKSGTPACAGWTSNSCTQSACCDKGKSCADFSFAWAASQLLGQGCAVDTKFFDTKKVDVGVVAPAGEDQVKAACCTPFSEAKCSDWAAVLGSCSAGKQFVGTKNAAPDSTDGKTLSRDGYRSKCCIEAPKTCGTFQGLWVASQLLGQGCAVDTKFFDTKKSASSVASPAGDDQVKAACCTPFADAKCSDWTAVLGNCPSGKSIDGAANAPPDSADGKTLSKTKYQEMCCKDPLMCADYDSSEVSLATLAGPGLSFFVTSLIAGFKL